jgi:succinate dehydrogenase/fumarate reductase flavoprotein subunit
MIEAAKVAEALAYELMDRVDRAAAMASMPPITVGDGVTIVDVAHEEDDPCFGILLSDGRTFEVAVHETAPVPKHQRAG